MELENRYFIFKITDARAALTEAECEIADIIYAKVREYRRSKGEPEFGCLCIENDWPEYEPTLKLLSDRVDTE